MNLLKVIVDEASMLDVELAAHLLQALPLHARIVLVGDQDQLPSVGPGSFYRDLLACKCVPRVVLSDIFRQVSRMTMSMMMIVAG
jgi:exodeoxyribonuclease V alpha subunit